MAHPMGESKQGCLRVDFDRRLKLEFHGSKVTTDAGLLAYRELDASVELTEMVGDVLADSRTGMNGRHGMVGQFRQSVFGRLGGYDDVNDADRLSLDPVMRWIVGGHAVTKPPATSAPAGVTNQFGEESQQFSRGEISMLQNLVSRREHLEQREQQLQLRENLIVVAERRVEERINELKRIEAKIQSLLKQHDDQEEEKLQRLVKMYQTMKPKDAARIFQTLDMAILIEVVERMSERRMAPIMAAMESERAKDVTTELATRKKLPERGG